MRWVALAFASMGLMATCDVVGVEASPLNSAESPTAPVPTTSPLDRATEVARRVLTKLADQNTQRAQTQDSNPASADEASTRPKSSTQRTTPPLTPIIPYFYGTDPEVGETDNYVDVDALRRAECRGAGAACLLPGKRESEGCAWGHWSCRDGSARCERTAWCPSDSAVKEVRGSGCDREVEGRACRISGKTGVCAIGKLSCQRGWPTCVAEHASAQPELCNGLDDNCDGEVDNLTVEGCDERSASGGIERCNGVDDNGDGYIDEGTDGGACDLGDRPGRLLCVMGRAQCSAAKVPGLDANHSEEMADLCNLAKSPARTGLSSLIVLIALLTLHVCRKRRRMGGCIGLEWSEGRGARQARSE